MATILDGKLIAGKIKEQVKKHVESLKKEEGITPGLAVIIVGENPASQVYVRNKHKACLATGIYSEVINMEENITEQELFQKIDALNQDARIHGILVQLPLPEHIHPELVLDRILPAKDVDGFHPVNVGKLSIGRAGLVPCTPYGIIKMLDFAQIEIRGKRAVVIGRSNIVGKPIAMLLLARDATVTVCHSRTKDLAAIASQADILVAAVGKPRFVTRDMVKPGAVVIDVGINRLDGKLIGDVDFDQVRDIAGHITPVPGGVGPLTIAMLLHNTLKAVEIQRSAKKLDL